MARTQQWLEAQAPSAVGAQPRLEVPRDIVFGPAGTDELQELVACRISQGAGGAHGGDFTGLLDRFDLFDHSSHANPVDGPAFAGLQQIVCVDGHIGRFETQPRDVPTVFTCGGSKKFGK